ncbi:hypothetical protein MTO96_018436 [Rhipicephalus appendiculatus]
MSGQLVTLCQGLGRLAPNFLRVRVAPSPVGGRYALRPARRANSSSVQPSAKLPFEVDTNVAQHTEIYRYDNFRVTLPPPGVDTSGRLGGLFQFLRERLTTQPYRYGLVAFCTAFGTLVAVGSSMFVLRNVRSLLLLKGGQRVAVQTYAPFRELRAFQVPLEHISCGQSRLQKSSYITLKIKGHWLYYVLDQRGVFPHPELFDNTVGMARKFK